MAIQFDKLGTRPNAGSRLRLPAKTARQRFLAADVTPAEHDQILEYCLKNKISVSQFLAECILQDAENAKTRKAARIRVDLEFTAEEYEKLELLLYVRKKSNISELLRDFLQPHLDLRNVHTSGETRPLRFYLSDQEHETVTKYLASRGITARKYVSFLALRAITKTGKGRQNR